MKTLVGRLLAGSLLILTACQATPPSPSPTPTFGVVQPATPALAAPTASTAPSTATPQLPTPTLSPVPTPSAAAPSVTATPAPPPSPTAIPTPTVDRASARAAIRERVARAAAQVGDTDPASRAAVAAGLQGALGDYLKSVASLETLAGDAASRDDLATTLTLTPPASGGSAVPASRPRIALITVNPGDFIVIAEYSVAGLPLIGAGSVNGKVSLATLPMVAGLDPNTTIHFERAVDLTGDGENDLVLTGETRGASDALIDLAFLIWTEAGPQEIFSTTISQWAGPAEWHLVANGGRQDLVISCLAFGPFDHKLLAHPRLTKTYRWNGQTFAVAEAVLAPPVSPRDAFNRAEVAFRAGNLTAAIERYRQVSGSPSQSPDEDAQTNWAALAALRIGQSQALGGDLAGARQSLGIAEAAGGTIGELARAFRTALDRPDGVVRGLAALQGTDLEQRLYNNTAGNLGFSVDPTGLAWPGLAISAYLQAHPEVAQATPESLRAALEQDGLRVTALSTADLDGDGQREIVALLPVGSRISTWIIPSDGRLPPALLVDSPGGGFARIVGLEPGSSPKQQLVVLAGAENASPTVARLGLADGQPAFFTPDRARVRQSGASPLGQCSIAEGL